MEEEKLKKMFYLMRDIVEQSTRKDRASDLKRYLVTDLEIIEKKSREAWDIISKEMGIETEK